MDNSRSKDSRSATALVRSDAFRPPSQPLVSRGSYGYGYGQPFPTMSSASDDGGESDGLLEYWNLLRRNKGTWLMFAFFGAVLGFLVTLPQTPIYQARTTIEIQGLNDNFLNMRQTTQVYDSGGAEISEIPTQLKILQSESLIELVVAQLKNEKIPVVDHSRLSSWRRLFNLGAMDQASVRQAQIGQLVSSLKARAAGQTRVIEIVADCSDPNLAAAFVNTMASKFIEQNLEARWKATEKTAEWLSHQLDDMRIKLEKSEDALQQYARASGLLFTDEKTNVSEEKLKQLQQELSLAMAARVTRQSTYELAQKSSPDALPDVLADPTLRETASKIRDLRSQIADLSAIYTPDYAKVRRARAELAALQATFERDRAAILGRIRNEYQQAARREELLQTAYTAQSHEVSNEGEKSIQYNILKREVDSNRQLYDSMLAQLKQSSIASAMRASNVRVVDTAKIPATPYKPELKQSAGVGAAIGVFLGAVFIILRSRADRTIQQPGETALYLDLPELGIIPAGKNEKVRALSASGANEPVELEMWQRKPSVVAESFRAALISILFAGEGGATGGRRRWF